MTVISGTEFKTERPPKNTQWVLKWLDLPNRTTLAAYQVTDSAGKARVFHFKRKIRRVVEGLMRGPVYCASPCRLSHYVMVLRDEYGIDIETKWYGNDDSAGRERYGVYFLRDKIALEGSEVRS